MWVHCRPLSTVKLAQATKTAWLNFLKISAGKYKSYCLNQIRCCKRERLWMENKMVDNIKPETEKTGVKHRRGSKAHWRYERSFSGSLRKHDRSRIWKDVTENLWKLMTNRSQIQVVLWLPTQWYKENSVLDGWVSCGLGIACFPEAQVLAMGRPGWRC